MTNVLFYILIVLVAMTVALAAYAYIKNILKGKKTTEYTEEQGTKRSDVDDDFGIFNQDLTGAHFSSSTIGSMADLGRTLDDEIGSSSIIDDDIV